MAEPHAAYHLRQIRRPRRVDNAPTRRLIGREAC
jgi:hypothetical protein